MTRRTIVVAALLSVLLAACGGTADDSEPGPSESAPSTPEPGSDSLADLVRTLPDIPDASTVVINFGDVEGLAVANGVPVPTDGDVDSLLEWAQAASADGVPILLPTLLRPESLGAHDEYAAELGVSLWGTTRFAGADVPPHRVAVIEGDHDESDLADAIGPSEDGIWSLGGEDLEVNPSERTIARPLGDSLRLALVGDRVLLGSTTRLVRDGIEERSTIADDEIDDVLTRLDDPAVVSGLVVRTPLDGSDGVALTGAGFGRDGDDLVGRLVLGYLDEDAAADAVTEVEDYLAEGSSRSGARWAELFSVGDVSADGSLVVVELAFSGEQRPAAVVQMLTGFPADLPQAQAGS